MDIQTRALENHNEGCGTNSPVERLIGRGDHVVPLEMDRRGAVAVSVLPQCMPFWMSRLPFRSGAKLWADGQWHDGVAEAGTTRAEEIHPRE
jgi:hypothetical protein